MSTPSLSYLIQPTTPLAPFPAAGTTPIPQAATSSIASSLAATLSQSVVANIASASSAPSATATASSAAASPSASAAAVVAPASVPSFPFLWHINILLLVLLGIFFLSTLPRTFARISHPAGRFKGLFLASGGGDASAPPAPRLYKKPGMATGGAANGDDDEETRTVVNNPFADDAGVSFRAPAPLVLGMPGTAASRSAPTRVPSLLSLTHPAVFAAANYPVLPGLPLRKFAVLVIYFGIWLYAGLYKYNPFTTTPFRAGVVVATQVPLAVLCVMKNNPVSALTGVAYEKLNFIHRFVGRCIVIAANAHALAWFFSWNPQGPAKVQAEFSVPFVRWGLVALVCVDLLFVCSLRIVRERAYGLFLATHVVAFIVFVIAFHNHFPGTLPYLIAAFVLYGFDHLARASRARVTTAYITAHPSLNGGSTHIALPGLRSGWRAGQHVRLRVVPPEQPGWLAAPAALLLSRVRAHPFSIASRPDSEGLELIVKKAGRATSRLYELAGGEERSMNEKARAPADGDVEAARETRRVRVVIEGPYSGPHTLFEAYSGVVLVAGGSGISYTLSLLDDLLAKHAAGAARTRVVEVLWSVADPGALSALLPTLAPLLRERGAPAGQLALRVRVHYTRAPRPGKAMLAQEDLPQGVALVPGRPNYARVLEETCDAVAAAVGKDGASGVGVTHCGPGGLGEQINKAVGSLSYQRWRSVSGVEVHSEAFGW